MVSAPLCSRPGATCCAARLRVDQLRALAGVVLRDEFLQRHLGEIQVGVVDGPVLVGQLLGLDEEVQVLGRVRLERADVERLQHVEDLQRGDALAVGRDLPHVVAAIAAADRLDPVGLVVAEVAERKLPAHGLRELDDPLGQLALVETPRRRRGPRVS